MSILLENIYSRGYCRLICWVSAHRIKLMSFFLMNA
jgi:hypothetical protein